MTNQEFLRRRQALLAKMPTSSAVAIFAAPEVIRSNDIKYPYRQNSDFWYFTGFNEPKSMFLLIKNNNKTYSVLFNRVQDITHEIWYGRCLGQVNAIKTLLVDRALPWENINEQLHFFLRGLNFIYHAKGYSSEADNIIYSALNQINSIKCNNVSFPIILHDWRDWVHELRLIKSYEEQDALRRAGYISALSHTRAIKKLNPSMYEYQIEAEIHYEFNRHGARFPAYNTIVASGSNACILHYSENTSKMYENQLVLIDAGCEFENYASDITRTVPVSGKFTIPQRAIYNIVLASLKKALMLYCPGTTIQKVTTEVVKIMVNGLVQLGIMHGDVSALIADNAHCKFFMHSLSHWIGLDVHDVGNYGFEKDCILKPGMALTVEPGLYINKYDKKVPVEYRGIGIRLEDTIIITMNGNENLTDMAVKKAKEIELLIRSVNEQ